MRTFVTKVTKLNVPAGTRVTFDEGGDNIGKTGMLLCSIEGTGSLFYKEDELEEK